jgi:hypothetical protein
MINKAVKRNRMIHRGITARKMISKGWMSIWVLKVQTPMDMEKERKKT